MTALAVYTIAGTQDIKTDGTVARRINTCEIRVRKRRVNLEVQSPEEKTAPFLLLAARPLSIEVLEATAQTHRTKGEFQVIRKIQQVRAIMNVEHAESEHPRNAASMGNEASAGNGVQRKVPKKSPKHHHRAPIWKIYHFDFSALLSARRHC